MLMVSGMCARMFVRCWLA